MSNFNLPVIMGNSAAFVNLNPNVVCADNNQNNVSINVTDGTPSLKLNNQDESSYLELDDDGNTNITDFFSIGSDGSIITPHVTINKDGKISGDFVNTTNLSVPHTLYSNEYLYTIKDIMNTINTNNKFYNWILNLQSGDYTYIACVPNIETAESEFETALLAKYPAFSDYDLNVRIVVATNDGILWYDTNATYLNRYAEARAQQIGPNINTRPCVMTIQTKDCANAYETQTLVYPVYNKRIEYFCAQRISYDGMDFGNNWGSIMFSFTVNKGVTILN